MRGEGGKQCTRSVCLPTHVSRSSQRKKAVRIRIKVRVVNKSDLVLLLPQMMTLSLNIYGLHVISRARGREVCQ